MKKKINNDCIMCSTQTPPFLYLTFVSVKCNEIGSSIYSSLNWFVHCSRKVERETYFAFLIILLEISSDSFFSDVKNKNKSRNTVAINL